MKFSSFVLPAFAFAASALVIPSTDGAVAGSIAHPNGTQERLTALETEYVKLEALKHKLYELHHEVLRQEHSIFLLINKDFKSCSGIKCYLQTAIKAAPDVFELVKTHFRHPPKNSTAGAWDCPWTLPAPSDESEINEALQVDKQDFSISLLPPCPDGIKSSAACEHVDASSTDFASPPLPEDGEAFHFRPHDTELPPPPPPPPQPEVDDVFFDPAPQDDRPHPGHRPDHHGPPPPFMGHPEYEPWKENPQPPAPHPQSHTPDHDMAPPFRPHRPHRPHRPFHMPHPAPRNRHFKLILVAAGLTVSTLIFAILFKATRVYLSNPRVRADRAARKEECRTRHEYRKAAYQHRIRQAFSRFRRRGRSSSRGTADYEEKRSMLRRSNSESSVSNHIVGADINSLRRAHEIVGRLMLAEEGRMHVHPPNQQQPEVTQVGSSSRSVHSLQTSTTLPPYAPPPPRYSQELSRDMDVVDGFRYTPSQSAATEIASSASSFIIDDDDLCTESSVIDCRSRMSMDTDSVAPSVQEPVERSKKSLELAGDRFRGQFD